MWVLFKILAFLTYLLSSNIWVRYYIPNMYMPIVDVLMTICLLTNFKNLINIKQSVGAFVMLIVLTLWTGYTIGLSYSMVILFSYLPAILLLALPTRNKCDLLHFVTKGLGIILLLSLGGFYMVSLLSISSPFGFFQVPENSNYPLFQNYIVFIKSQSVFSEVIYRFNGPFIEPGHLAIVCSILLYANKFNFKECKWLWIILISVGCSLSLAGYVLSIVGFIFCKVKNLTTVIVVSAVIGGGYLIVTEVWNDGANPVNELIVVS